MNETFLDGRVIVKVGDITEEDTQCIVNAANATLMGGGGVDGAIHAKGGPSILEECRKVRERRYADGLPTGEAVITTSGMLYASYVIHTVGPIYGMNNGRDADLLDHCYTNCLDLADGHMLRSVAFPSISTGAYGFPKPQAAIISSKAIKAKLETTSYIDEVRLVFFSESDAVLFLDHHMF